MTGYDVRTRCQVCGTWYWAGLGHACPTVLVRLASDLVPGLTPTDLPGHRAGVTVRYSIDDDLVPHKRAVLKHEAAPTPETTGARL